MSENNRYYAADLARVTKAVRGGSARFNRTLKGDFHPMTEALTTTLFDGGSVAWDLSPLRHQSWEVFAELSMLVDLACRVQGQEVGWDAWAGTRRLLRSEEHTSELQSRGHLVCRLLLEKKKQAHTRLQHVRDSV